MCYIKNWFLTRRNHSWRTTALEIAAGLDYVARACRAKRALHGSRMKLRKLSNRPYYDFARVWVGPSGVLGIGITTRDRWEDLALTLSILSANGYGGSETIVIDDGSRQPVPAARELPLPGYDLNEWNVHLAWWLNGIVWRKC